MKDYQMAELGYMRMINGTGDPDAVRHRTDDPDTIAEMRKGRLA